MNHKSEEENCRNLPIARNEDIEFSVEAADAEDLEALERAADADKRQEIASD